MNEDLAKAFAAAIKRQLGVEASPCRDIPGGAAIYSDGDAAIYAIGCDALAVLHPCGVSLAAARILAKPDERAFRAVRAALKELEEYISGLLGIHPDIYLAGHEDDRDICCIYCLAPEKPEVRDSLFNALMDALPVCSYYREEGGDAMLFRESGEGLREDARRAAAIIEAHCARAGLCGPYERAISARGCLTKAWRAAKAEGAGVLPFGECRYGEFWRDASRVMANERFCARDFCHEALWRMREYDISRGTEYVKSLRAYLDSGRSPRKAADLIGVHRNTMAYRMRRVEELFGVSLDDGEICFELQFSMRVVEFLDATDEGESSAFFAPLAQRAMWAVLRGEPCKARKADARLILIPVDDMDDSRRNALLVKLLSPDEPRAAAFDDDIIYIAQSVDADTRALKGILRDEGLPGVVSQPFSLERLHCQMRIMRLFMRYVRSFSGAGGLIWANGACSTIFYLMLQQKVDLAPFCCDEVLRVTDVDYLKGSTLSASLYAYLTHYTDIKGAANEKRVHRNTLDYQVKKALALIGEEPLDDLIRFEMLCTYRILLTTGYSIL
ncbi:MAG: helix-turn-helix domain-containing protein [Clostridia bacterium]|nr:helix-turn-helix domain-containing protein [Clostridia bacterium]